MMSQKWSTLGSNCELITRGVTPNYDDNGTGFIVKSAQVFPEQILWENCPKIESSFITKHKNKYALQLGDVLLTGTGTGTLGRPAIIRHIPQNIFLPDSHLNLIRVNLNDTLPEYVFYWLCSSIGQTFINKAYTGSTNQIELSAEKVSCLPIPLVTLKKQKQIVSLLNKAGSIRRLRKYALKLTNSFLQSVFMDMFGDYKKFEQKTVEDIAEQRHYALSSGPFGSNLTSKDYVAEGIPVLRGFNVTSSLLDLNDLVYVSIEKFNELTRSEVRPGDVVVVAVGASGIAKVIPPTLKKAIMSQNFNKITPDKNIIHPVYLEFCINSQLVQNQFKKEITDTVRTFLSLTKLKEVPIPVPPIDLQMKFVSIVEQNEKLNIELNESLRQSEMLFQSLLHKAFSGELSERDEKVLTEV